MQVSVEAGEGLERRMKVDLPFEEVEAEVDKRLQKLARTARLPGFRPGKVPMKVLRQRFAVQVHQEVFGEMVQSSYEEALTQTSLRPAGMPQLEPELDLDGKRLSYTATFEVIPEFELASLEGRELKRPVCELTDADLETMVERLRAQRKTWVPVERPCQNGDQITVSLIGSLDGEAFEGGSSDSVTIELGASRMIPGFEDALIGTSVGEQRTLDLAFPEDYQAAHLAGKPVRFEVTLKAVTEPALPAVDAEFAKAFGVEDGDLEHFQANVRANIERELKDRLQARIKERVMDLLFEANPLALPRALVENEMQAMADKMRQSLGDAKFNLPPSLFEIAARRRVALGLILGKIVNEHDLKVDAEQLRNMIGQLASTYEQPQAVIDYYYKDRARLGTVEAVLLEDQVVKLTLDQLKVEDEAIDFAALTSPRPEL